MGTGDATGRIRDRNRSLPSYRLFRKEERRQAGEEVNLAVRWGTQEEQPWKRNKEAVYPGRRERPCWEAVCIKLRSEGRARERPGAGSGSVRDRLCEARGLAGSHLRTLVLTLSKI